MEEDDGGVAPRGEDIPERMVFDVDEVSSGDEDEAQEEEYEQCRMSVLKSQWAMGTLCVLQIAQCAVIVWLAEATRNDRDMPQLREFFNGCVGMFSGVVGLASSVTRSDVLSKIFLVLQLWMLATNSTYMYLQVNSFRDLKTLCRPERAYSLSLNSEKCTTLDTHEVVEGGARVVKLVLACTGLFLTIITCLTSFQYTRVLDDFFDHQKHGQLMKVCRDALEDDEEEEDDQAA
eukprot:TRINITY_DN3122_c0_g2_i1.p2 TRINITY_DN3122_c0_g2~~TRINITY_DN3122_c0_g2_i1.p2  ORF type:complete len:253 (+),score=96.12 TRINITY_DN3122_c0_g2_i1:61-759(+)